MIVKEKTGMPERLQLNRNRKSPKTQAENIHTLDLSSEELPRRDTRFVAMDAPFFMLICTLLMFGMVMVYSASYAIALRDFGTTYYYIIRQAAMGAVGFAAMLVMAHVDYGRIRKYAVWILLFSIAGLILVLFIGTVRNNAQRWIILFGISIQPSEITKLGVIVFLAAYIDKYAAKMKTLRYGLLPYLAIMAVIGFLLYLEPHMSALILIAGTGFIMIFLGGLAWKWIVIGGGLGATVLTYLILFTDFLAYIERRFAVWLNPFTDPQGTGYQTIQSLLAVGSGGLFGLGLGNSRQKQLFLPEAHNDYVFAIICEELGYVGAMLVIILFAALIARGFWIAFHARDKFGSMLAAGIMILVTLQILLNIAVVTNSIPVTGMSLPFFSYGGTSLGVLLFEMGIVLSVSRQIPAKKQG